VSEKEGERDLQEEIERGRFVKAAQMAQSMGLPKEESQEIIARALWEMAAVNRNAPGTKRLAQEYEISRNELKELLEGYAEIRKQTGDYKTFEPCYDISMGAYLSFEEWMDSLMKRYDKVLIA
jgi:hypothetical protein